jgi:penicillin-binding protein 1C
LAHVQYADAMEPPRDEWFIAGTQQPLVTARGSSGPLGAYISSPLNGTVFALDPDIPPQAQKLALSAAAGTPLGWRWRMDGKLLGPARATPWALWPGPHRLDLLDQAGQVVETVSFAVRGAELKRVAAGSAAKRR